MKSTHLFARSLEEWFAHAQRDLPWRQAQNARDPYRVLVSEIMLQQTTVAATIPFYQRFLIRFPDIASLSAANTDEVLTLWAGLGYYSRARNLHRAAQIVCEKHDGIFPKIFDEVLALPGVGRYTAGAILSIAFDQAEPIVDANVARVLARVLCLEGEIKNSENQKKLWKEAATLVKASTHPAQFNPAMMELGALVCTPQNPRCDICPVSDFCRAFSAGRQNELPHIAAKKPPIQLRDVCVFLQRDGHVLLRRRSEDRSPKNWWRGMWELPRATCEDDESTQSVAARALSTLHIEAEIGEPIKTLKHTVTVHAIKLECRQATLQSFEQSDDVQLFEWDEIHELALPSTMRKLLAWLRVNCVEAPPLPLL